MQSHHIYFLWWYSMSTLKNTTTTAATTTATTIDFPSTIQGIFGGAVSPPWGKKEWSRKYNFVTHPNYDGLARLQQEARKVDALSHLDVATRQTRVQRYADIARGNIRLKRNYASKGDRGTDFNTHNYLHVDRYGNSINDVSVTKQSIIGTDIGPFAPVVPSIVTDIPTTSMPPIQPVISCHLMPPLIEPTINNHVPTYVTPSSYHPGVLVARTVTTDPNDTSTVNNGYVFKLLERKSVITDEGLYEQERLQTLTREATELFNFIGTDKTEMFIDENLRYYVMREETGHPTWDSPVWVRHYLSTDFATSFFGRTNPIIPGIDLNVSRWLDIGERIRFVDLIGTMQFKYANTYGSENFTVTYN